MDRPKLSRVLTALGLLLAAGRAHGQTTVPLAAMTPAAWRADLRFAVDSFLPRDRSFSDGARARFRAAVAVLADSAGARSNEEMVAGLAQAVALAGNAHTRLYLLRNRSSLRRLPIRVWSFADGVYVIRAREEYADLVGARVVRVCGHPVAWAERAVRPLYAGNDAWARYMAAYTLTSPETLAGAHVCPPGASPVLTFAVHGRTVARALRPLPLRPSTEPTEAWWDLAPAHPGVQGPWVSPLPADTARLPLYLRAPARFYGYGYLPRERLLYVQMNRAENAADGPSVRDLERTVLAALRREQPRKVVVDLRFNTGGNLQVGEGFMRHLASAARASGARLYVITGISTFSAGLTHVAQLRQFGGATIVGEGPGEGMEFWSEGGNLRMPRSGLTLHYADRMHRYSRNKRPRTVPLIDLDLYADRVTPQVVTPLTFAAWIARRDPSMEAIVARP